MADQHIFSIAPLEMARDRRLGAPHLRILLALLSFRNKTGDLVWPKRERLAEITGYQPHNISKYTRQLVDLGWLEKTGSGGRSRAVRYRITVPEIPETETVSGMDTVSKSETVSKSGTKTVSKSDTRIEQTNEQTSNPPVVPPADHRRADRSGQPPPWINRSAWAEFETHRREIRKPLTDLARVKAWNQLRELSAEQQQRVIDYSIAGRYTGLFPERANAQSQRNHKSSNQISIGRDDLSW